MRPARDVMHELLDALSPEESRQSWRTLTYSGFRTQIPEFICVAPMGQNRGVNHVVHLRRQNKTGTGLIQT